MKNDRINRKVFNCRQALQAVTKVARTLPGKIVSLKEALQRVTSSDVLAAIPQPTYDESTRDGFAICVIDGATKNAKVYRVVNEIPAGRPSMKILRPGTACRIMTGGCVPEGTARVVPYEDCVEEDEVVTIAGSALQTNATFIRRTGSEIARGERLVAGGTVLQAGHLALLASCGVEAVSVSARPAVGYACTGSELTNGVGELRTGQKISSNAYLLGGLLASVNANPVNMGIVQDDARTLLDLFAKVQATRLDAMITTGGMGPGKYDLVERAFVEAGGKVIFNAIAMRPGKSFLFGTLGATLFFGLPGPPHAVRTLLNELVGPALLAMQGRKESWPKKVQAHLQHQINIRRNDILHLRDGVLILKEGNCFVRAANPLEMGNCFILLPPGREQYRVGEPVDVHLAVDLGNG